MDAVGTGRAPACRPGGPAPVGVYRPRRAQASPLFRLVSDQFRTLQLVYNERFAPTYRDRGSRARRAAAPCGGAAVGRAPAAQL